MKTTLNIADPVMAALKQEAAKSGRTMSEMVEEGLRLVLRKKRTRAKLRPLPAHNMGTPLVDIADRDALYRAMDGL